MSRLWHTNTRTDGRTVESRAVFSWSWIRNFVCWPSAKGGSLNKRAAHLDHYNVLHIALFWCKQQWVGKGAQACTKWCDNAQRGVHCKDAHGGSHAKKLWIKSLTMQLMQSPSIKLSQLQGRRTVQSFVYHVWSGKRLGEVEKRTFKGKRVELGKKSATVNPLWGC